MKARTAFIALALASAHASAEWEFIGQTIDGDTHFMDLSTKRQQGKYTLVWEIENYAQVVNTAGRDSNSVKKLAVYVCSEFLRGIKSYVWYSEKNGKGNIIYIYSLDMNEIEFTDAIPETSGELMLKKACGK